MRLPRNSQCSCGQDWASCGHTHRRLHHPLIRPRGSTQLRFLNLRRAARGVGRLGMTAMVLLLLACSPAPVTPVKIDPSTDTCHSCRMTISNPRLALQILDAGEEPRLFDDIGCAVRELRGETHPPRDRRVFVADMTTGAWMPIESAALEQCSHVDTPMGSHLVARKTASHDARCSAVLWKEILR